MNKKEFIKRAVQIESNAFIYQGGANTEASDINPHIFDQMVRDFEEKALVVTPLAEVFDFRGGGVDYKVTVDDRPSAAAALVETVDITVSAFTTRNVTFTPLEYGVAYQLTRQEAVRAFFNVAERMVKKLGYSLAEKKDALAIAELLSGATSTIIANSVSNVTALASTDTLKLSDISRAMYTVRALYYKPTKLIINAHQEHQLRTQTNTITLADASAFGSREVIESGRIGRILGLDVYVCDTLVVTTNAQGNIAKAVVMGESRTGESALAYAIKRDPIIEREYHARGRYWDIVAHEEYDFAVIHPDAVCTISTYSA